MKRVKFKKEFKSIQEALNKVPSELKIDNNEFEMTDGNKTINVRWEGTLEEGKAIPLTAKDEKLISEDVSKMKRLMGYKSEETIGNHKAEGRLMENDKLKELLSLSKKKVNEGIVETSIDSLYEEAELLDEGMMGNLKKIAMILGLSMATFGAMAQENPKDALNTVKSELNQATPEQLNQIEKATGIKFSKEGAGKIFDFSPKKDFGFKGAPKLYLGKYGDINVATVTDIKATDKGGLVYTVDISDKRYVENGNIFRYISKQNTNLNNTTINFTYKNSPIHSKSITYK